jgi:hypothetical protein
LPNRTPLCRRVGLFIMALLLPALAACSPSVTSRYKVTMTVYKGEQAFQAVGIQETRCYGQNPVFTMSTGGCHLEGEAIPLKMGEGGYLIATMSRRADCCSVGYYAKNLRNWGENGRSDRWGGYLKDTKKWVLKPENYPLFITFADMNNPRSVAEVDPANLAATFGDGWRFGAMNVEVVSFQPITMGRIDPLLPWLKEARGGAPLWGGFKASEQVTEKIEAESLKWARN